LTRLDFLFVHGVIWRLPLYFSLSIISSLIDRIVKGKHIVETMAVLSRPTTLAAAFLLAASSSSSSSTVHAQEDCASNLLQVAYPAPVAADGWEYRLVAQNLTRPRGILFDADGALLVVDRGEGIKRFEIEDNGGTCVSVGEPTVLTDDEDVSFAYRICRE
jgi:glucose/arabinose dehydrogenase